MAILGVAVLLPGLGTLLLGGHSYTDYRGLVVFAPVMIAVGVLLILIAVKKGKRARAK